MFPEIEALLKPPRKPCDFLRPGNKRGCCGAYGQRPKECREFNCLFLIAPMPEHLRPDKSGFVLSIKEADPHTVEVWQLRSDVAWEGSPVSNWLMAQNGIDNYKILVVRKESDANHRPAAPPE